MGILKNERSTQSESFSTNGAGHKVTTPVGGFNAILDRGSEFEGKLTFEGTVRIDGTFKGQIYSESHMVIGESGKVEGDINVGSVSISGSFQGNIHAKTRVELHKNAVVEADIDTPSLVIEDGVQFDGKCSMSKSAHQKKNAPFAAVKATADKSKNGISPQA
ncbi:MAG: polymer-forming cytoskeletal protein [Bdellovibrionales bacterium]|nr:polymer-forming cytoskeletal protein [Bdellovibrionales bacterium]